MTAKWQYKQAYEAALEHNHELKTENARLREELAKWERLAAGIDLPEYPVTQFKPKDLERENAKLREEIEAAKHDLSLFSGELVASKAENTRLRELAAILCHCMQIKASCDDCRINGHKGELARDPLCACDSLHKMLRELGVEVGP